MNECDTSHVNGVVGNLREIYRIFLDVTSYAAIIMVSSLGELVA